MCGTIERMKELFHPLVYRWFYDRFKRPTDVQQKAWPVIAKGKHVLISAPTGTGKTLTAFLWALNRLIDGTWECGSTRVLYVSPLKALNNDIQRNLLDPLQEIKVAFSRSGVPFPEIRALTRSGDTPQAERQRMVRRPPEILITTPESLNLILSSPKARIILSNLQTVILDEIHAIAAGKRGTHLITAIDRLVPMCGEFQRIAVSATVRPLDTIAQFVGGFRQNTDIAEPGYRAREVNVVLSDDSKKIDLSIRYPVSEVLPGDTVWRVISEELKTTIQSFSSTLIFVNSRKLAEQITQLINLGGDLIAYAHHGSLAKELRRVVELRLKEGSCRRSLLPLHWNWESISEISTRLYLYKRLSRWRQPFSELDVRVILLRKAASVFSIQATKEIF